MFPYWDCTPNALVLSQHGRGSLLDNCNDPGVVRWPVTDPVGWGVVLRGGANPERALLRFSFSASSTIRLRESF